jgi:hypothetical protein
MTLPEDHVSKHGSLDSRAPTLDVLDDIWVEGSLLVETHLGSEGGLWYPSGGSAGCGLLHHAVNLFESQALGFWDKEVGIDETDGAKRAPDEEDLGSKVALVNADHVWGNDGNDLV